MSGFRHLAIVAALLGTMFVVGYLIYDNNRPIINNNVSSVSNEYRIYEAEVLSNLNAKFEPAIDEREFLTQSIDRLKSLEEELTQEYSEITVDYSYNDWDEWTPWLKDWEERVGAITYTMKSKYDPESYKDAKWEIDLASLALLSLSNDYTTNITNLQYKLPLDQIDPQLDSQFQKNISEANRLLSE